MRRILILLLFSILSNLCIATAQIGDLLIWNNDTLVMFSNPLDKYCDTCNVRSGIIEKLNSKDSLLHPDKYLQVHESLESTACWRGYSAVWKLKNNKLYLDKIMACHDPELILELKEIFPQSNNELFAEWYTGDIILPQGKCLECVHLDYLSIYEKELVLKFANGVLIDSISYQNTIGKKSSFFNDYISGKSREFIYSNIRWEKLPELKSKSITVFVAVQPNENGQIDSINFKNTYALDGKDFITDSDNKYIQEAIRIARLIKDWDVVYQRGNIVGRTLTIDFNENLRKQYVR